MGDDWCNAWNDEAGDNSVVIEYERLCHHERCYMYRLVTTSDDNAMGFARMCKRWRTSLLT